MNQLHAKVVLVTALFLMNEFYAYAETSKPLVARLREEYSNISEVKAEFESEKESTFLAKPLKSTIRFSTKDDEINWSTTRPLKSQIQIKDGLLQVDGKEVPPEVASKLRPLLLSLNSLLGFKWSEIYSQFTLKTEENTLNLTPKSSDLAKLFEKITIDFDAALKPMLISIKGIDESTVLHVRRFDVKVKKDE